QIRSDVHAPRLRMVPLHPRLGLREQFVDGSLDVRKSGGWRRQTVNGPRDLPGLALRDYPNGQQFEAWRGLGRKSRQDVVRSDVLQQLKFHDFVRPDDA